MFFRFGAALLLVVVVSLVGAAIEKQNFALRRLLSHQQYRREALHDSQIKLRLEVQRLGTPARLLEPLEQGKLSVRRPDQPQRQAVRPAPLLNWSQEPATR